MKQTKKKRRKKKMKKTTKRGKSRRQTRPEKQRSFLGECVAVVADQGDRQAQKRHAELRRAKKVVPVPER
jgi:hypothetical protein